MSLEYHTTSFIIAVYGKIEEEGGIHFKSPVLIQKLFTYKDVDPELGIVSSQWVISKECTIQCQIDEVVRKKLMKVHVRRS